MTGADAPPITAVRTTRHDLPLSRPWAHDVTELHVIGVEVSTADGGVGTGISWTPTIGAHAVQALLDHDIRAFVLGRESDPRQLWPRLWRRLHEAGSGGLTTIAMSGVDLALWDLQARRRGLGLTDLLGRRHDSVEVYGSGVNLHYSLDELVAQARRWLAAGYRRIKIKVGRPDPAEDRDRVAAVREVIGPDVALMLDANQRWDLDRATAAMAVLAEAGPAWIEEPLLADDLAGHAELRRRIDTPVALGENLHTWYRFREAIDLGACDVVQPNVVRVGGITPLLEIAALAEERGVALAPHLLPELSGQVALALARPTAVEDVEDASFAATGLLAGPSPVAIEQGRLCSTGALGLGLELRP